MEIQKEEELGGRVNKPERRHDVDWLRFIAVFLLFFFHTARIFDIWGDFYVKDDQISNALSFLMGYLNLWHMPLFFLLAGASTWFALRFRSGGEYTKERLKRLLLPLIFGIFVIIPPQSYLGLRNHSSYAESFLQYYPHFFQIIPADMDGYFLGGFTVGHLWFILFLFLFSLIALPIFIYLNSESGQRLIGMLASSLKWPGMIFLLAIPLVIVNIWHRRPFGLNLFLYFVIFIYGFIIMADSRFSDAIDRHKAVALIFGPVMYIVASYFSVTDWPEFIPAWSGPLLDLYFGGFAHWFFLIALLGYGKKFLGFTNRFLKYVSEASYPFYILHQTVIVIIGFYVVQWDTNVPVKFFTIVGASFLVTVLFYDILVKRTNVTRFLFGMKPLKKT